MKIINICCRQLTETERTNIEAFASVTGTQCFACLSEQAFCILPSLAEEHVEELVKIARERMAATNEGVDYSRFYMPGGYVLVGLPGGICAMSEPGNEGEPSSVLMLRHMAIDACQDGQLVAIVFNYDEEQPEA